MSQPGLRVQDGLRGITRILGGAGIDNPAKEARLLMAHVLGLDPTRMTLHAQDDLLPQQMEQAQIMTARRASGTPMSHILGYRDFYGRRFHVNQHVLDPRPETEGLVAAALSVPFDTVLDLGTGSGCILLTLLAERTAVRGVGGDLSETALRVAAKNAESLGVQDRVVLKKSYWFNDIGGKFDLIVSNPPYIAPDEIAGLSPEVRDHEPRMALTDEHDGLDAYRAISAAVVPHLTAGGWLMVEIGATQGQAVSKLFDQAGLENTSVLPDLDGRDRVVKARYPVIKSS